MLRFAAALALTTLSALLVEGAAHATSLAEQQPFAVSESPIFYKPRHALERLAASQHTRAAGFCVVGYRGPDRATHAWVVWPERRALILWEPTAPGNGVDNLALSRRWLDLERDVVASEADVAGSTYLVTRAWADRVIADCRDHGERFRVHVSALRTAPLRRAR